ncbi:hypothetical protein ACFOUV_11285 [Oceanobacillus longus]|uniref:Uncharacterized protein n=1 Tax=Oceanobacillus longus TaxID=930120 RepID=A0ABV8GWY5_9BACI
MSVYQSRRNRRDDDRFDVDEVLIRTDRVNVIDVDDRRRRDDDRRRKNRFDDDRRRCDDHRNRRLVINADEVTILADDVFIRDDHDRDRDRRHDCCCGW